MSIDEIGNTVNCLDAIKAFVEKYSAELVTTRKAVDNDILPYNMQGGYYLK